MDPTRPFRTATQTIFGSVSIRRQKSGAPGAGPQLTTFSRPAVVVEGRDEEERAGPLGEGRADEDLDVLPVLTVRGGGHRDDGDRADLGGEKAEAYGPGRHPAARQEEVHGVALPPREPEPDPEQNDEGAGQNDVVRPGQHMSF